MTHGTANAFLGLAHLGKRFKNSRIYTEINSSLNAYDLHQPQRWASFRLRTFSLLCLHPLLTIRASGHPRDRKFCNAYVLRLLHPCFSSAVSQRLRAVVLHRWSLSARAWERQL